MEITIDPAIFENYPNTHIGFIVAEVQVKKEDPTTEGMKEHLPSLLEDKGLIATTFTLHPAIAVWREIYQNDFKVKPKTYRSSLEALIRRVLTQKKPWKINNIVDLYNCISVQALLPMGAYDVSKIKNNIYLRYAKSGEKFRALGTFDDIEVKENHVVYSDDEKLLCWLWNHKDSTYSGIDEETTKAIFFIDSFDKEQTLEGLKLLETALGKMGCNIISQDILSREQAGCVAGC